MLLPPRGPRGGVATCTWCGRPSVGRLCDTCTLGLEKYPDQNPPIVAAYVEDGMQELDAYLSRWAAFDRWLAAHQPHALRFGPRTR